MTALSDFVAELAAELDARPKGPPASDWLGFLQMMRIIDRDDALDELRQQIERVISHRDVPLQDRAHALIPLLRPYLSTGGTVQ